MTAAMSAGSRSFSAACWRIVSSWRSGSVISSIARCALGRTIVADEEVRRERAAARGHHAVDERAARQLPQEEKAARATYVVANSGTVEELFLALSRVLEKLTSR